jgi:hypothetical protein
MLKKITLFFKSLYNNKYGSIIIISFIIIIVLWFANLIVGIKLDSNKRGVFGDMFGAVNALFSGLAFAGIIISLYMQQSELKLQRKELKLQRKELSSTNKEFHIQNQTMELQKFENTFFNMLSIHHQIVRDIDYKLESIYNIKNSNFKFMFVIDTFDFKDIIKSRDVFKFSYKLLSLFMKTEYDLINGKKIEKKLIEEQFKFFKLSGIDEISSNSEIEETRINKIYELIYGNFDSDYGHYFRNMYRIIKIIDSKFEINDNIEDYKAAYKYTSILRSQLSDAELKWLFFNCLSKNGYLKFKPLIEKYSLLKNLAKDEESINYYSKFYLNCAFFNPQEDEEIVQHLSIDFYNNKIYKPTFNSFISVKAVK